MEAQQTKLDVTAHNIANVSTAGYKKSRAEFADLMYQTMQPAGAATGATTNAPTGTEVGLGTRIASTARSYSEGELSQTGNALDVAIQGQGFFQVTMPDGTIAYTRNGAFQLDAEGKLVTHDGYALAGDLQIPPDAQQVTIAADGTVTATMADSPDPVAIGQVQLAMFANPAGLSPMGDTLFKATVASGQPIEGPPGQGGAGSLLQGSLEMSNVNVVQEMVDLIAGQRAYEINTRVVKAADDMLGQTAQMR
jgi:flagellar basal-body rod protein FlgG